MARQKGSLKLVSNIEPQVDAPLDARAVVAELADLTAPDTFPYSYVGMVVYVRDPGALYVLQGPDPTQAAAWKKQAAGEAADYDLIKPSDIDKLFVKTPTP